MFAVCAHFSISAAECARQPTRSRTCFTAPDDVKVDVPSGMRLKWHRTKRGEAKRGRGFAPPPLLLSSIHLPGVIPIHESTSATRRSLPSFRRLLEVVGEPF